MKRDWHEPPTIGGGEGAAKAVTSGTSVPPLNQEVEDHQLFCTSAAWTSIEMGSMAEGQRQPRRFEVLNQVQLKAETKSIQPQFKIQ